MGFVQKVLLVVLPSNVDFLGPPYEKWMHAINCAGREWRKIRVLGRGAFGEAQLVHALDDPRCQAVCKVVHLTSLNARERKEAENEAEVLKQLKHPNIVGFFGSFEDNSTLHILMEFCNSGDLEQLIQKQKGVYFSEDVIATIFIQMSTAVRYLHDRRILHRDLKSQNVFLSQQSPSAPLIVKLGDFGISKILRNTIALAKTVCGTPYYFSPEICLNRPYNNKSDVWSLGCILYEMTQLKHAFDGKNIIALMARILSGKYSCIPAQYHSSLGSLIDKMLQQKLDRRFSIQQVMSSNFVLQHTERMYDDHLATTPSVPVESDRMAGRQLKNNRVVNLGRAPDEGDQRRIQEIKPAHAREGRLQLPDLQRLEMEQRMFEGHLEAREKQAEIKSPVQKPNVQLQREVIVAQSKSRREPREYSPKGIDDNVVGHATRQPSTAELAKAFKNRVSEDAPWVRNRVVPVGFTKEGWEKQRHIQNGLECPISTPPAPPRVYLPRRGDFAVTGIVEDIDVDKVLRVELNRLENCCDLVADDGSQTASTTAQHLWEEQLKRIRQAEKVKPTATKVDEVAECPRIVYPSVPPTHSVFDDEYSLVIEAMKQQALLPPPPELFEEGEVSINELVNIQFTLDGKTLDVCNSCDPLSFRVEALTAFLQRALGGSHNFLLLHQSLASIQRAEVEIHLAEAMLAKLEADYGDNGKFVDLMMQLMLAEGMVRNK